MVSIWKAFDSGGIYYARNLQEDKDLINLNLIKSEHHILCKPIPEVNYDMFIAIQRNLSCCEDDLF